MTVIVISITGKLQWIRFRRKLFEMPVIWDNGVTAGWTKPVVKGRRSIYGIERYYLCYQVPKCTMIPERVTILNRSIHLHSEDVRRDITRQWAYNKAPQYSVCTVGNSYRKSSISEYSKAPQQIFVHIVASQIFYRLQHIHGLGYFVRRSRSGQTETCRHRNRREYRLHAQSFDGEKVLSSHWK